jgi:hypothetical protein
MLRAIATDFTLGGARRVTRLLGKVKATAQSTRGGMVRCEQPAAAIERTAATSTGLDP